MQRIVEWVIGQGSANEVLGAAGGIIAIILAGLRVYEFWQDRRPRLSVSTYLTSDPWRGNDIVIFNASKTPANISYYDLVYWPAFAGWLRRPRWARNRSSKVVPEYDREGEPCDVVVPPHGHHKLSFSGRDHFPSGKQITNDLFLRIWVMGEKRPSWFWITGSHN